MCWSVWRVWLAGFATLEEIECKWSLVQLAQANEALDIMEELQTEANKPKGMTGFP